MAAFLGAEERFAVHLRPEDAHTALPPEHSPAGPETVVKALDSLGVGSPCSHQFSHRGRHRQGTDALPATVRRSDDIHPTSVAAAPEILRALTACGYRCVRVSHLCRVAARGLAWRTLVTSGEWGPQPVPGRGPRSR